MTIASEITRINGNIAAAYTAAGNKGATMHVTQNSANLATCIGTISTGTTPSGTISITTNGTYDVTNYASASVNVSGGLSTKYGANINTFLGDVNANGVLQSPTEQSDLVFTGVIYINTSVLAYRFYASGVKTISFPDLTTISSSNACESAFRNCSNLNSISFPRLTTISSSTACSNMFAGDSAGLTTVSFPSLTTISGQYACNYMFYSRRSITSASFPSLTTISGQYACNYMFSGCTGLEHVYFNALTTTSFGSYVNQFSGLVQNTGKSKTHTLHFPSNLSSTIAGLMGYPNFGGTSDYVTLAFDLDPTE